MAKKELVARLRVSRGSINELIDRAYDNYKENGRDSWGGAFKEAAADMVIARHEEKIRNGFARAGLHLPEGELGQDEILAVVRDQTGLELDNLNPDAVMAAVDRLLSNRLSQALGVQVSTVFDQEAMIQSIQASVVQAIRDGRAGAWLSGKAYKAARRMATLKNRGVSEETWEILDARRRQKKFRRTHHLQWR